MNSLDRVQLVEAIAGYNDLKENLAEYLKKFVENKKVVKEEDIREFFDGMMARKKQKVSVPHFCH
jgi:E3 ubiquitin-protein ligase UBR7